MDCNKEDALRAKEVAEKKFKEQDIAGAKRFALKAQNLYPKIEGLAQLIATLDVCISAEKSTDGESDWYRILGVDPLADEPTIRNKFKKLAYVIHPDRNKSVGADGAFKILTEAWSFLSNKGRIVAYDQKRNLKCKFENVLERQSLVPDGQNDVSNLSNGNVSNGSEHGGAGQDSLPNLATSNVSNGREHRDAKHSLPSSDSSTPIKATFWTSCSGCKVQFEYHRSYLDCTLLCSNCRRPFRALELPPSSIDGSRIYKPWASHLRRHNSGESTSNNSSSARQKRPTFTTSTGQARFSGPDSRTSRAGLFSDRKEEVEESGEKEVSAERIREPTSTTSLGQTRFSGLNSSQNASQAGLFSEVKEEVKEVVDEEVSAGSMRAATSTAIVGQTRFSVLDSSQKTFQAGLFSEVKEKREKGKKEAFAESMRAPTSTTAVGRGKLYGADSSLITSQAGLFLEEKDRGKKAVSAESMRAPTVTTGLGLGKLYGLGLSQITSLAGLLSEVRENEKERGKKAISAESMRAPTLTTGMGWDKLYGLNSSRITSQAGLFSESMKKEKDRGKKAVSAESMRAPTSTTGTGLGKLYGLDSSWITSRAGSFLKQKGTGKKEVSAESMRALTSATGMEWGKLYGLDSSWINSQAGLFLKEKTGKKAVSAESMRAPTSTTGMGWGKLYGLDSSRITSQAGLFSELTEKEERGKKAISAESMRAPTSTASAVWGKPYGLDSSWKTSQAGLFFEAMENDKERGMKAVSAESMTPPTSVTDRWCWKRKFREGALDGPEVTITSSEVLKKVVCGVTSASSVAGLGTIPKGDNPQKRRRMTDQKMESLVGSGNGGVAAKTMFGSQEGGTSTTRWNMAGNCRLSLTKELSLKEVQKMLMEKAKNVIIGKLPEWRNAAAPKIPNKSKQMEENERGKKEPAKAGVKADMSKHREHVVTKKKESTGKIAPRKIDLNLTAKIPAPVSMTVVDPDFYDFDMDRTERSFIGNQVWAAYDQEDGMPRYYAMIHYVISEKPFKMRISWLNSNNNDEFGPSSWIAAGFPKTIGEFQAGRSEICGSLNSFSHQVKWTKGARGVVQIYPSKGDIWALYRNWSPNWNERTPDEVIHEYDMVEVLEDYNEAGGVSVYPLVKIVGFRTVFCRHWDPRKVMKIPRTEMFRFSHQVPSHILTGKEGPNAPTDCVELDPAATPLELLKVTKEKRKEEVSKQAEKPMEGDPIESLKSPKVQELVENSNLSIEKDPVQDAEKVVAEKNGKENEGKLAVSDRQQMNKEKTI